MKAKIVKFEKGKDGLVIPEEYLRALELAPGVEVEIGLDKERKWIVIRPMHGEDFLDHFKNTIGTMA